MSEHGGYRRPGNPAPVSGPGQLSRRTDGGPGQPIRDPGGLPYGENQQLHAQMQAAPMARQAQVPTSGLADLIDVPTVPIGDGTRYPDEPITAGAAGGPGLGPEVLASAGRTGPTRVKLQAQLPVMQRMADQPGASPEFRALVRYLRVQV